jgi:hypothetical protein
MQYLKKTFDKLDKSQKLEAINKLMYHLNSMQSDLNRNSNGDTFISYIFDPDEIDPEYIEELEYECKLTGNYNQEEINKMKIEIKELQHQLNIYKEIEDINIEKEDYYDHNEGWKTTNKKMKIIIKLKKDITLKIRLTYLYNGYDSSSDFYKTYYIYKNDKELKINEDYYKVNEQFYNGKKISKKVNSLGNFQEKIKQHCLENKIDFENLSETEMLSLMQENLTKSKKIKQEIDDNEQNKNTTWTLLLNLIIEKMDQDSFESLIDKMN